MATDERSKSEKSTDQSARERGTQSDQQKQIDKATDPKTGGGSNPQGGSQPSGGTSR